MLVCKGCAWTDVRLIYQVTRMGSGMLLYTIVIEIIERCASLA